MNEYIRNNMNMTDLQWSCKTNMYIDEVCQQMDRIELHWMYPHYKLAHPVYEQ